MHIVIVPRSIASGSLVLAHVEAIKLKFSCRVIQHGIKSQHSTIEPTMQIDLTGALPTEEVFWLNFEEGYFACQG